MKLGRYRFEYITSFENTIILRAIAIRTGQVISSAIYPKHGNNIAAFDAAHKQVHDAAQEWATKHPEKASEDAPKTERQTIKHA